MSARTLQLDVGNTLLKWRVTEDGKAVDRGSCPSEQLQPALETLPELAQETQIWVASVSDKGNDDLVQRFFQRRYGVTPRFAKPCQDFDGLRICYSEPEKLGVDRWLSMLAARRACRGPVCVVDAGSALTIDFVDGEGRHEGGFILPGLRFMQRALTNNTRRINGVAGMSAMLAPACETGEAVMRGCLLAACGAVERAFQDACDDGADPKVFLTGGDATLIAAVLNLEFTLYEDLVFEGMDRLL